MKIQNPEEVVENLRRKIAEKGMTRKEVCEKTGISPITLSTWLTGKHTPAVYSLYAMAHVLECSVEELLTPYKPKIDGKMDGQTIEQWRARAITAEKRVEEMRRHLEEIRALMNEGIKISTRISTIL